MNQQIKNMISNRGLLVFRISRDYLVNEDAEDSTAGNAFKFSYLIRQKPNRFLSAFKVGDLHINIDEVEDFYCDNRTRIPGPVGLLPQEISIIERHNRAADLRESPIQLSLA